MKSPLFFRSAGNGTQPDGAGTATDDKPQTDNTRLVTTDTVYVSTDGGTTDEAFPVPSVEYDFCVDVSNAAKLASGAFYVRFSLDNGNDAPQQFDFQQDAGLDAGQSVKAVVHFGQFTDEDVDYTLSACIFSPSAPETTINCAGTFGFNPHLNNNSTGSGETSTTDTTTDTNTQPVDGDPTDTNA